MKLVVVIASVREGRIGGLVGEWAEQLARQHGGFTEVEVVDLMQLNLPLFNEPNHPVMQDYKHDLTKQWAATVDSADSYLFVTPEYDYFAPSSLVNAVQYLSKEWSYKPVGFVSYGGVSGGLRSVQSIKPLLATVKLVPIPEGVAFPMVFDDIQDAKLVSSDSHASSGQQMLDELVRWSKALAALRA